MIYLKQILMNNITIKIILDSHILSDGKQGVYLRATKNRKTKKINLGIKCKAQHFNNGDLLRGHEGYKVDNQILAKFKIKALEIIRLTELEDINLSLEDFAKRFRGLEQNKNFEISEFSEIIEEELKAIGKMSSAKADTDTRKSLNKFKEHLTFEKLTPEVLDEYESYLLRTGSSNGGVAFRMRQLRALYNKAIKRGKVNKSYYPFDKYKVSKIKLNPKKTALSIEELKAFRDVNLIDKPTLQEAYDYFMFSFYARGMNFHDIMLLKHSDIKENRVFYQRSKTGKRLNFELIKPLKNILKKYSEKSESKYVFPILLRDDMTSQQIKNRKQKVLSRVGKKLKTIAGIAGIEKNLTFYVARHSFATIQKKMGSPIEKISEMLGHKDISITMVYLKDFSNEELDAENKKLLEL